MYDFSTLPLSCVIGELPLHGAQQNAVTETIVGTEIL